MSDAPKPYTREELLGRNLEAKLDGWRLLATVDRVAELEDRLAETDQDWARHCDQVEEALTITQEQRDRLCTEGERLEAELAQKSTELGTALGERDAARAEAGRLRAAMFDALNKQYPSNARVWNQAVEACAKSVENQYDAWGGASDCIRALKKREEGGR